MHNVNHNRDFQPALSVALLMASALWCAAFCEYYAASGLKGDWSATPLLWMLIVMAAPAVCFALGIILAGSHRHARLSRLGWCALVTALFPVTFGTLFSVWTVRALFSMSG